jgi:hypothetical protein
VQIKRTTINREKKGEAIAMKNFRQLVFFYLITLAGLLWAVFLLMDTEWLFPALAMAGLIIATNIIVLILWFKS